MGDRLLDPLTQEAGRYEALVVDLKRLIGQATYHSWELLRVKHAIGTRILREEGSIGRGGRTEFLRGLAAELEHSVSDLYNCERFATVYPTWEEAVEAISPMIRNSEPTWYSVIHGLLYGKDSEEEHQGKKCDGCHRRAEDLVTRSYCQDCHSKVIEVIKG